MRNFVLGLALLVCSGAVWAQEEVCPGGIVAPDIPCYVHNDDIKGLTNRVYRALAELSKAQSGRVTALRTADYDRFMAIVAEVLADANAAGSNHGDTDTLIRWPVKDFAAVIVDTENEAINDAQMKFIKAALHLIQSQSGRLNDGLLPADLSVFVGEVNAAAAELTRFYEGHNPMDMRNSTPSVDVVEPAAIQG